MASAPLPFWLYLPLAALALGALILLYFSLFRDQSRARRRCPGCWYDLSGASHALPIRCPECGRQATTENELRRSRRHWWRAAAALVLLLPLVSFFAYRDGLRTYYLIMPRWKKVEIIRLDDCTASRLVARNPADRESRALVTTGGNTLLDITDWSIEFGADQQRAAGSAALPIGAGEPNNGIPTLVVFAYSGGAHCCYTVYVVELTSPARIIATIDGRNGIGMHRSGPAALHPDELEFNLADQSFDYWNASHAESPFPSVWYRIRDHHLELALDKMLEPAATVLARHTHPDPVDASIPRLNSVPASATALSSTLWACMLDLIYSGNEPECWEVFEANWPAQFQGPPSKAAFKKEFLETLQQSPQYQDFQAARTAAAADRQPPPALAAQFKPQPPP